MVLLVALIGLPLVQASQASCAQIQALKQKVYTFRPSALDAKAQTAKSKELDGFWNLVQASKPDGVVCLQDLLRGEKEETFFLYDGASLLASLDRSEISLRLIVESLARAPLAEVDPGAFVNLAIALAREKADIAALAERFLSHPADKISAPAHALTVDRMYGIVLLFGCLPMDRADAVLRRALESGQPRVRDAAAMTMAALLTEDGLRVLSASSIVPTLPEPVRKQIDQARRVTPYKPPARPPAFTRDQVLEYLRLLPSSSQEYTDALDRQTKYEEKRKLPSTPEAALQAIQDDPPFTSLAGHTRFLESAVATLTAADLPALREWRRNSVKGLSDETLYEFMAHTAIIIGVINRLDVYGEYRIKKRP